MTKIESSSSSASSRLSSINKTVETAQSPAAKTQPKAHQAHVHNAPLTNLYVSKQLLMKEGYVSAQGTITKVDAEKMWLALDEGTLILEKFMHGVKEEVGNKLYLYILKEQFEDLRKALAQRTATSEHQELHKKFEAFRAIKDSPFMQRLHQFFPHIQDNFAPQLYGLLSLARRNAGNMDALIKNLFDPKRTGRMTPQQMENLLAPLIPIQSKGFSSQMCPLYDGTHYKILEVHYLPPEKQGKHKHFEFNLKQTPFGALFIEGLYDGTSLHLKVKTEKPLDPFMKDDLNTLYMNILKSYNLQGTLKFEKAQNTDEPDKAFAPLNIHL